MNGSGLKGIRCSDSGITRYSVPLTLTLSPKGRGEITFDNTTEKREKDMELTMDVD
jgi:hypothetical protein